MARGIVKVMGRSVVRDGGEGQDAALDLLPNYCGFNKGAGVMQLRNGDRRPFILRGWTNFICELQGRTILLRSVS
jgi:hypothetical protein